MRPHQGQSSGKKGKIASIVLGRNEDFILFKIQLTLYLIQNKEIAW